MGFWASKTSSTVESFALQIVSKRNRDISTIIVQSNAA
jgi:hypothetical protein